MDKLCAPPSTYGVYLSESEDGTITILSQGRRLKVNLHPAIDSHDARPGHELILNEGFNVIETDGYEIQGEVVVLKGQLDHERALDTLRADEEKIGIIAEPLRSIRLHPGDHILMDSRSNGDVSSSPLPRTRTELLRAYLQYLTVITVPPGRGGHCRIHRDPEPTQHPRPLTRRKARRQQSIVDFPRYGEAVERRWRKE